MAIQVLHELRFAQSTTSEAGALLGLSDSQLGTSIGVSRRTIQRYRHKNAAPRHSQRARLEELSALLHVMRQAFGNDEDRMQRWMNTPVSALGGRTPRAVLLKGKFESLTEILAASVSGTFQ